MGLNGLVSFQAMKRNIVSLVSKKEKRKKEKKKTHIPYLMPSFVLSSCRYGVDRSVRETPSSDVQFERSNCCSCCSNCSVSPHLP
jgi:hypothetical protein